MLQVAVSIRGWNRSKSNNMKEQIVHSMRRGWNRVGLGVLMEKEARRLVEQGQVRVLGQHLGRRR